MTASIIPAHRILMIIAPDQFRDEELLTPRDIFLREGWVVDTISTRMGQAHGMKGAIEAISRDVDEVVGHTDSYDAVVVIGGMGSIEYLWDNEAIHQILRDAAGRGRVVAAICLSGAVPAKAGLLDGKKATVWETEGSLTVFRKHNVQFTGEPVTQDGLFITANGPDAAATFGEAIVKAVKALNPAPVAG
jgi:protease I